MHTLRTFRSLIPAQMAQAQLRSAGIEAIIPDESSATLGYGSVVGGVRLQVREEDAGSAETLLRELDAGA